MTTPTPKNGQRFSLFHIRFGFHFFDEETQKGMTIRDALDALNNYHKQQTSNQRAEISDEAVRDAFSVFEEFDPKNGSVFSGSVVRIKQALSERENIKKENIRIRLDLSSMSKLVREYRDKQIPVLKARLAELEGALREMMFAYKNKDGDMPHDFEIEAVKLAEQAIKAKGE